MIQRFSPGKRLSQAVLCNDMLYISGQVAEDKSEGLAGQMAQVLARIDRLVLEAGGRREDLVAVTVILPQILDAAEMNRLYEAWVDPENPPSRTCYEARLSNAAIKVEIAAICWIRPQ